MYKPKKHRFLLVLYGRYLHSNSVVHYSSLPEKTPPHSSTVVRVLLTIRLRDRTECHTRKRNSRQKNPHTHSRRTPLWLSYSSVWFIPRPETNSPVVPRQSLVNTVLPDPINTLHTTTYLNPTRDRTGTSTDELTSHIRERRTVRPHIRPDHTSLFNASSPPSLIPRHPGQSSLSEVPINYL